MNEFKRNNDTILVLDRNGNVYKDIVLKDGEELVIQKKTRELTPEQKAFINNKNELKNFTKSLGGYINMFYVKNELLFNKLEIDRANISRLIYLSTYIDYNDRQENLLVKHSENYKIEHLSRNKIKKLLKLSEKSFIDFMNNMIENKLIFKVDEKYYITNEYFSKGEVDANGDYTRIFINTTRMLFENCTARQHKHLSYLYQLIPFMNYNLNVLCKNSKETDISKLEKLSLKEICKILNISTDCKSTNRFENNLLKLYIIIDEKKQYVFKRVIVKGYNCKNDYFVINPNISWSGNNFEEINNTTNSLFFK